MSQFDDVINSTIARKVALLTPVLAGVLGAGLFKLQKWIGVDLQVDPAIVATYVGTIVLGTIHVGAKWLEGRKEWEKAALELHHLYQAGAAAQTDAGPASPPGIGA